MNVRLMRGKVKGTQRVCVAISRDNAQTSLLCVQVFQQRSKEKATGQISRIFNVTFHRFPPDNEKTQYAPGMNERERRRRWNA